MIERRSDIAARPRDAGNRMTRAAAIGDDEIGAALLRIRGLARAEDIAASKCKPHANERAAFQDVAHFAHAGTMRTPNVSQKITSEKTRLENKPAKAKKRVRPSPTSVRWRCARSLSSRDLRHDL